MNERLPKLVQSRHIHLENILKQMAPQELDKVLSLSLNHRRKEGLPSLIQATRIELLNIK